MLPRLQNPLDLVSDLVRETHTFLNWHKLWSRKSRGRTKLHDHNQKSEELWLWEESERPNCPTSPNLHEEQCSWLCLSALSSVSVGQSMSPGSWLLTCELKVPEGRVYMRLHSWGTAELRAERCWRSPFWDSLIKGMLQKQNNPPSGKYMSLVKNRRASQRRHCD